MARALLRPGEKKGRTQATQIANDVVYMGPAAHTPLLPTL